MNPSYPSNLTSEEWELLSGLIPGPKTDGRKRSVERDRFRRLITIWVDGGYRGKDFQHWVMDVYRWMLSVVARHEEQTGFVVLPKRWLVERTFGLTDKEDVSLN